MSRLTKIDRYGHYYTNNANCRNIHSKDGENIEGVYFKGGVLAIDGEAIQKLGKLEDLEEELGCPLDIFINIMLGKITEIVVNYSDAAGYDSLYEEFTIAYVSGIIESYEHPGCLCLETNLCDMSISDYGKNWWLKGEKNERIKM